jgi:hypothetical protein
VTRSWSSPCPVTWPLAPISRGGRSVAPISRVGRAAKLPCPIEESSRYHERPTVCLILSAGTFFPISRKSNIFRRLIHVTFKFCVFHFQGKRQEWVKKEERQDSLNCWNQGPSANVSSSLFRCSSRFFCTLLVHNQEKSTGKWCYKQVISKVYDPNQSAFRNQLLWPLSIQ